jgi:hypothetical protein
MQHEWFDRLAGKLLAAEPPCCSDAEDWEDAGGWAAELDALAEAAALQPPAMPLDPGQLKRCCSLCVAGSIQSSDTGKMQIQRHIAPQAHSFALYALL